MTRTYFVGDEFSLPTVSLAVDPEHLWSDELGIYVKGDRRNFTRDWERPAHIEFHDAGGRLEFSQDVGVQIHGGWSRNQPQKSLAVRARRRYGNEAIHYPLFPDKPLSRYKGFVLRNSGNDWTYTLLRDAIMQALVKGRMDIDYPGLQACRSLPQRPVLGHPQHAGARISRLYNRQPRIGIGRNRLPRQRFGGEGRRR